MDLKTLTSHGGAEVLPTGQETHWTHQVAAAALVAGAILLVTGRKRQAFSLAAGGAALTLLERPEAAQELWSKLPSYIRNGQDFLVKAEGFIEKLNEQVARVRETLGHRG